MTLELRALVDAFREGVAAAVRKAAMAAMSDALGDRVEATSTPVGRPSRSARLLRRSESDIDAVKSRLLAAIGSKPGMRSEGLRARLKLERRELVLPLRKLVTERKVVMQGAKRAARYFPAMTSRTTRTRTKRRR